MTKFSIPSNWDKLKQIPAGGDFEKLKSIQGLRVYLSIMVVAVHTCLTFSAIPVSNTQWLEEVQFQ